jgi:DNA polymerase-3 subunit delta'
MLFNEVVGHSKQLRVIRKLAEQDRFPQSSLFVGPEGVGKRTVAEELFFFLTKNRLNVRTYGVESPPTIKEVREISEWLSTKPGKEERKAVIIDRADEMRGEAANALLKTLEEPPNYAFLCLIGKNEEAVIPTIRSRCRIFRFGPLSESNVIYILERKGIKPNEKAVRVSRGSVGTAIKILESPVVELLEELFKLLKSPNKLNLITTYSEKFSKLSREEALLFLNSLEVLVFEKSGNPKWEEAINRARSFLKFYGKPQSVIEWLILEIIGV